LDGHALQTRLKVAAGLAFLNGRLNVTLEDWDLSRVVMAVSDATRAGVQQVLASKVTQSNRARAEAEGERIAISADVVHERKVARVSKVVLRFLEKQAEPLTEREVKRGVASRDRDVFEEALDALILTGNVERTSWDGVDKYAKAGI
jgi:hypothetical protein